MISPFAPRAIDKFGPLVPKPPNPDNLDTLLLRNNENPFGSEHFRYLGFGNDAIFRLHESYLNRLRLAEETHHRRQSPSMLQTSFWQRVPLVRSNRYSRRFSKPELTG